MSDRTDFRAAIGTPTRQTAREWRWSGGGVTLELSTGVNGASTVTVTGPNECGEPTLVYASHDTAFLIRRAKATITTIKEAI